MAVGSVSGATRGSNLVSTAAGAAALSQILKEVYRPAITDQLNSNTVLKRLIGRRQEMMIEGKYMVIDLRVGRNYGFGAIAEGGRLPDPQQQRYQQARYNAKYSYGRIKFSGPAASASRSDRGSFIRVMDGEVQGLVQDVQHNDNRIMFGDGSGRLCQLVGTSVGSPGPWTVINPGGIVSTALGTQYLENGMRVAVLGSTNGGGINDVGATSIGTAPGGAGTFAGGMRAAFLSAVDKSAGTVNFVDAAGNPINLVQTSGTHYLYLASEASTDLPGSSFARGYEQNGLAAIVDDADPVFQDGVSWAAGLGAIPVASFPVWRSPVIDNAGTPIAFSPDMFQQLMDLEDQTAAGSIDLWVTTHGIRRQYLNLLVAAKQYVNTMELDGGFKSLTYDGRPLVVDKDATRGRIYGLSLETLFIASETDYNWMDADGSILTRMENQDAFQACLYHYWEMGTDARNRNGLIQDILDP